METEELYKLGILTSEGKPRFIAVDGKGFPIGIKEIKNTHNKKAMRCITVEAEDGIYLTGDCEGIENCVFTHNSFLTTPFIMARSLLFPNHHTTIMGPTGSQAMVTFTKLEDTAKGKIASLLGTTSVFLDECVKQNAKDTGFSHEKNSYYVSLYNGSDVTSISGVAKNVVGIRLLLGRIWTF